MINIAFVIDTISTPNAGTEKQLLQLISNLDLKRFQVFLVCLTESDWMKKNRLPCKTKVFNCPKVFSWDFFKKAQAFRNWLQAEKIDIVQAHFFDSTMFSILALGGRSSPIFLGARRNIGYQYSRFNLLLLKLASLRTDFYLANSLAAGRVAREKEMLFPRRIHTVYNGLDVDHFGAGRARKRSLAREKWRVADETVVVGIVANLRPIKNHESLIRVAARLKAAHGDVTFVAVGEGPERVKLQTQIESLGLSERFLLLGASDSVADLIPGFDIGVLCSLSESFSNSLIEYMAAGLPVVASDVGGNNECISHGETGFLYPVGDEHKLEGLLTDLIIDVGLRNEMGGRARRNVEEKYSIGHCIYEHEQFYSTIVTVDRIKNNQ